MENILEDTINKLHGKQIEESLVLETDTKVEEPPPEPEPKAEEALPPPTPKEEDQPRSRPASKKGSWAASQVFGNKSEKSGNRSLSKSGKKSAAKEGKGSRVSKKVKTPEPEPEPEAPPGTPPPQPGSDEWKYVNQSIKSEVANVLSPQWDMVEKSYIDGSKQMFRKIRYEREGIIRYFYQIRNDYLAYLRRPDHKQEFVAQWQKTYNEVPDDMRDDEEMRGQLHEEFDDLRERLWSICDEHKQQIENVADVMNHPWLDDQLGLVTNHYIMQ